MQMDRNRNLFWELLEPEHLRVRAFCRKLTGNRENGDDLCQEALVQAFRRFTTLRDQDFFRPWLYRIVVNRFKNSCRRPLWQRFVPLDASQEAQSNGDDPTGAYSARRVLERAFKKISVPDRALITLFEMEGWSVAELARLHGRSEQATKVRLFRIRRKMRDTLTRKLARSEPRTTTAIREDSLCIVTKPNAD